MKTEVRQPSGSKRADSTAESIRPDQSTHLLLPVSKHAPNAESLFGTSQGEPLETSLRADMENRFQHDFGDVRVHSDADATIGTAMLGARAATSGNNIAFGAGHYAPESSEGKKLLAHELAHVVQQSPSTPGSATGDFEGDADTAARDAVSGKMPTVNAAAPHGRLQLAAERRIDHDYGFNGEQIVIAAKSNGHVAVVITLQNGVRGVGEIKPPKGITAEAAVHKIGVTHKIIDGELHADIVLPNGWGRQSKGPRSKGEIVDKQELDQRADKVLRQYDVNRIRTQMGYFYRWADKKQGTKNAPEFAEIMKQMTFDDLVELEKQVTATALFKAFVEDWNRRWADRDVAIRMGPDIMAGFSVADVNVINDPVPDLPPVRPEVSGRHGDRYTVGNDTGLRYSQKLRDETGRTYGYYQRWRVYDKEKGLQLREVYVDLDGQILRKTERKVPANHEAIVDFAIGVIPIVGDAVEIIDLNIIAATGKDKWGNPVSDEEFFILVGLVAIPGALAAALAKRAAKKTLAQQTGKALADEAEFIANQSRKVVQPKIDASKQIDVPPTAPSGPKSSGIGAKDLAPPVKKTPVGVPKSADAPPTPIKKRKTPAALNESQRPNIQSKQRQRKNKGSSAADRQSPPIDYIGPKGKPANDNASLPSQPQEMKATGTDGPIRQSASEGQQPHIGKQGDSNSTPIKNVADKPGGGKKGVRTAPKGGPAAGSTEAKSGSKKSSKGASSGSRSERANKRAQEKAANERGRQIYQAKAQTALEQRDAIFEEIRVASKKWESKGRLSKKAQEELADERALLQQHKNLNATNREAILKKLRELGVTTYDRARAFSYSDSAGRFVTKRAQGVDEMSGRAIKEHSVDHVVPIDEIVEMDGFKKLSWEDQQSVLSRIDNLKVMEKRLNLSKGSKRWADWGFGREKYGDEVWKEMVDLENELRQKIRAQIKSKLGKKK